MATNDSTRSPSRNRLYIWLGAFHSNTTERLRLARREHIRDPLVGGFLVGLIAFLYDIVGKALNWAPY